MGFEQGAYGARIKQLRIGNGLTQEQLAERVRVTRTYIAKLKMVRKWDHLNWLSN